MINRLETWDVVRVISHQFLPLPLLVVLDSLEDGLDLVVRHLRWGHMQEHLIEVLYVDLYIVEGLTIPELSLGFGGAIYACPALQPVHRGECLAERE